MNVVVKSSCWREEDIPALFLDEPVVFTESTLLTELMVELGIYASKSKARQAGREGEIPFGWTEYKASKKVRLWLWNPSE